MLLLSFLISGCAGSPDVPFQPEPAASADSGRIYVYWPAQGWREKADEAGEVQLDGVPVGLLRYKTYISLEVPAGVHELRLTGDSQSPDWVADWEGDDRFFETRVKPGDITYVRLLVKFDQTKNTLTNPGMSYVVQLLPRSASSARAEMSRLKPSSN
jgi:hypothetical protein